MTYRCASCGAGDDEVRIFRPAGEFFRAERLRCEPCLREQALVAPSAELDPRTGVLGSHHVPCIESDNGLPHAFLAIPKDDLRHWQSLAAKASTSA